MYKPGTANIMAESSTKELTGIATKLFESWFGSADGCAVVFAPGRVNLIGEHTDYNGGFVMPLALRKHTIVVGRGRLVPKGQAGVHECRIVSSATPEVVSFKASKELKPGVVEWANYVKGVVFAYLGDVPRGFVLSFDAAIASDVPLGGGLSSSAALEVSVATLLEQITRVHVSGVEKALRQARCMPCQWSDHNFMDVPCGIMDQFVSSLAQEQSTLLVDCRDNSFETVPLDDTGVVFVVANSGIRHRNASGAYGERVQQCRDAVEAMKKRHPAIEKLRDASLAWVNEIEGEVDEKVFMRARHVVTEDRRTLCCAMALRRKDYTIVGDCMCNSHSSLKDDYEVSIPELDMLVSIAMGVDGVYGSRMTGGGFGGCTVTLVKHEAAETLMSELRDCYLEKTGNSCECFVTTPCNGAGVIVPLRRPKEDQYLNVSVMVCNAAAVLLVALAIMYAGAGGARAHEHAH
ncbi:unnamed protein product [Laminaria digitata]